MVISMSQMIVGGLLAICLASFTWGMQRFFSRPSGNTAGMLFTTVCGAAFAAAHFLVIFTTPIPLERAWGGVVLYLLSLALFWWAILTNRTKRLSAIYSSDLPTHLVAEGPYRIVRHPLYCSYLITWTAGIVATGQLWLLPTLAVMVVLYFRAASAEESKFMASGLAGNYEAYRARTGQLVPNPLKLLSTRSRRGALDAAGLE